MKIKKMKANNPSKIEMLYSTIHQMSKSEKRSFRLEMNKLKKNSRSEIVFDYLSNTLSLNTESFSQSMSKKNVQNPQTIVNYLFDKILSHLSEVRLSLKEDKPYLTIRQLTTHAETALALGFFRYAHKLRLKALDLAYLHEQYYYIAESLTSLHLIEKKYRLTGLSNILEKYSNGMSIEESILHICKLQGIKFKVQILLHKSIEYSIADTIPDEWEELINDQVFTMTLEDLGYHNYLMLLRVKQRYYNYKKDNKTTLALSKQIIHLQEENPEFTAHKFIHFIIDYNFLHHRLLFTQSTELEKHTQYFNDLFEKWTDILLNKIHDSQYNLCETVHHVINSVVQRTYLLAQKSFTLSDIRRFEIKDNVNLSNMLNNSYQTSRILAIYLCLLIREYEAFGHYKNLLAHEVEKHHMDRDTGWEMEILYLIEYYENNHDTFFKNRLINLYRKNKRHNTAPDTVVYMIKLIRRLSGMNITKSTKKKILEEALPDITQLESQSYKPRLLFSKWIEWRIRE